MTLLLGPPGCGKTTLLLALSGKLSHSLKVVSLSFLFETFKRSYKKHLENSITIQQLLYFKDSQAISKLFFHVMSKEIGFK